MHSISILGCGWLGLPLGNNLVINNHLVRGSTTRLHRLSLLANMGIKPYLIHLNPGFKGDPSFFECEVMVVNIPPRNTIGDDQFHRKQLESIKESLIRAGIKKLIFISSTAVFPNLDRVVREEDADNRSLSRNGISMLDMEEVFTKDRNFKTTVLRFGGLYGPDRHPGRFLVGKTDLPGAGNPVNMIHLRDCICIIKSIIDQEVWGEVFNACSPNKPSRKEFYTKAAEEIRVDPPQFNGEDKPYKDVSSEKLVNTLNYDFIH